MAANSYVTPPTWNEEFTALFTEFILSAYMSGGDHQAGQIQGVFDVDKLLHEFGHQYVDERTADLVKKIDASTRQMLKADIKNSLLDGDTPDEIAAKLEKNYAFSDKRALTIARSETGFAWNHAGVDVYEHDGSYAVKVYDGEDYDDACATANGQIWSHAYARGHLLQHPNCVRSFGPVYDESKTIDRE